LCNATRLYPSLARLAGRRCRGVESVQGPFAGALNSEGIMSSDAVDGRNLRCSCGHAHEAHEHYRRGSDCALCPAGVCAKFTPDRRAPRRTVLYPVAGPAVPQTDPGVPEEVAVVARACADPSPEPGTRS
jgi:hypothetical protein